MTATGPYQRPEQVRHCRPMSLFNNIKFFVLCHGMLQLAQLLVSGYLKGSISTIEKRYGLSSQKSGLLASFNEVGNAVLIVFVSFFGSRVHRPRWIGIGAIIASMAAFLIALPHFISGKYEYTDDINSTKSSDSGLCQLKSNFQMSSPKETCSKNKSHANDALFPILLLGQLLLGIGGVPIQPFGISYIDDYANKKNSPLYIGILFAITVIGPAFGYLMASYLLTFYVDFNKVPSEEIILTKGDPRWVGAWWLGFLIAGTFLFCTSLPYLFFPKKMITEETHEAPEQHIVEKLKQEKEAEPDAMHELSLLQFLKKFPHNLLRTLRNPIYLLVVLAQVNLAAMVAGLATFMPKFIERQFTKPASFSNIMIGGLSIPSALLGIVTGGIILHRHNLSVKASAILCTGAVLTAIIFAVPLLFLGCSTQKVAGIYPANDNSLSKCSSLCSCSEEAFNPVCGSDGVEYLSPCHAGCKTGIITKLKNYTDCFCVSYAVQGTCLNACTHLIVPFMILSSITCFLASLSQTPSFMMILRTVTPEDKSFALGIQFMLFRVLAFLPSPVLYGIAIDSTCILWGKKCNKNTSCQYYDVDLFRQRFLGLQTFFVFGGLVFFFLSYIVLRKAISNQQTSTDLKEAKSEQEMKRKFEQPSVKSSVQRGKLGVV